MKETYGTAMVAELTGLSERTVRRLAQEDYVKAHKTKGGWVFGIAAVKAIRKLYGI